MEALRFTLRVAAGALALGAFGLLVDEVFGIEGWWAWGICAGAIGGALLSYISQPFEHLSTHAPSPSASSTAASKKRGHRRRG